MESENIIKDKEFEQISLENDKLYKSIEEKNLIIENISVDKNQHILKETHLNDQILELSKVKEDTILLCND